MHLVIVESPTKAKTISQYLGSDFVVKSSFGHIRDLPKSELGIDTDHDFEPKYIIPTKAKKNVTALKKDAEKSDTVILATDEDREGEAIAWHLRQALGLDKLVKKKNLSVQRIAFHEITESAIQSALKSPREIDQHLVDAQQARRVLDRLVGYKISPILWKRYYRGLSAGRVQSVAVKLIVEREREIEKFVPDEYWTLTALLTTDAGESIQAQLAQVNGKPIEKLDIKHQTDVDRIISELDRASYVVNNVERTETMRNPHAAFTTSTLQQDASKRLHFSSKQTMMFAQQLYEAGYITYMRTDSVNLSSESLGKVAAFITDTFGKKYFTPRKFKTKSKSAQEAHEAIRPTEPSRVPEQLAGTLTPQQHKLYDLIWRRFTASQMTSAVFDATTIDISAKNYTFRANGTTLKFDGFLKIYPTKFEENNLPVVTAGQELSLQELKPEQHFTKPPARFNEASLIKILEKEGIGRPSTYAAIISTILLRKYVEKDRSRAFHPTEIGILVNDFLVEHFPKIVDTAFTSHMEDELDQIAAGTTQWVPVIREFYEPFAKDLAAKLEEAKLEKAHDTEDTGKVCEKCGAAMVIKRGRFGKFTACSNYPECKNVLKEPKPAPEPTGEKCEKCGADLVYRTGRFGKFIACSNYPQCKNTKKIAKELSSETDSVTPPQTEDTQGED
jgi:DNA topoisomerase-1